MWSRGARLLCDDATLEFGHRVSDHDDDRLSSGGPTERYQPRTPWGLDAFAAPMGDWCIRGWRCPQPDRLPPGPELPRKRQAGADLGPRADPHRGPRGLGDAFHAFGVNGWTELSRPSGVLLPWALLQLIVLGAVALFLPTRLGAALLGHTGWGARDVPVPLAIATAAYPGSYGAMVGF
jgi:hypothetical protein